MISGVYVAGGAGVGGGTAATMGTGGGSVKQSRGREGEGSQVY